MKTCGLAVLGVLVLAGCTSTIQFHPHTSTKRPFRSPVSLGVYYTTGTLTRVENYKNRNVRWLKIWRVPVGNALEQEAISRLKPIIRTLQLVDSPYPLEDTDLVLSLGIEKFAWENSRAETVLWGVLRGRDGAVLFDKRYIGTGSPQLLRISQKVISPEQGLGETTRDAMAMALTALLQDMKPFLPPPGPSG